jgi:hypothetical protein
LREAVTQEDRWSGEMDGPVQAERQCGE